MLDFSWGQIVLVGAAALIFIGPKELPGALRTLGQWMGKARAMAREFQGNIDEMIRESELDQLKKEVQKIESGELAREIEQTIDPKGEMSKALAAPDISLEPSTGTPSAATIEPPATTTTNPFGETPPPNAAASETIPAASETPPAAATPPPRSATG
ncbi:MAG: twin-arginine translocase subunit TatB [Proteobacteria bacterium]|nr:twin-arginine translocase subunit TatB [Pseudomonadota bacterium]